MARLLRCGRVILDGELHFADTICWCMATHDEKNDCNYHNMEFEKEVYITRGYYPSA